MRFMTFRLGIILAGLAGLFTGMALICFPGSGKPDYAGKSIDAWFEELDVPYSTDAKAIQARTAFKVMGRKAVPFIIREFRARDSRLQLALLKLTSELPLLHIDHKPAPLRHWQACFAMDAIGTPDAVPALPALTELLENRELYPEGPVVLAKIGQAEALPFITRLLNNQNTSVRSLGAMALVCLGEKAGPAIPEIMESLKRNDAKLFSLLFDGRKLIGGIFGTNAGRLLDQL